MILNSFPLAETEVISSAAVPTNPIIIIEQTVGGGWRVRWHSKNTTAHKTGVRGGSVSIENQNYGSFNLFIGRGWGGSCATCHGCYPTSGLETKLGGFDETKARGFLPQLSRS
jgi:hypothetical protein